MFWDNFVTLCNQKGKSPNGACAELGFSANTATKWKQGSIPRDTTLRKIADYFGVTVDELLADHALSPKEIKMFPGRMIELMKEKKISKKQISRDLNFGINQIKYWEENHNIPNALLLSEIANYLGTNVSYLLGTIDDPAPSPIENAIAKLTASIQEATEKQKAPSALERLGKIMRELSKDDLEELGRYADYLASKKNN